MATQTEVFSVESKCGLDHVKQQLGCGGGGGGVASCGDRANGCGESCAYVSVSDQNGVSDGSVEKEGSEVNQILKEVENANVEVDSPVANGIETKVDVGNVDVSANEVQKVNVEEPIEAVDDVNVEVDSLVANGIEAELESLDGSVKEVQKVNLEVPVEEVDDVNVAVDSPVANGVEAEVENVDVWVKEVQKVNVEVPVKAADDANVAVDSPVVNGIETTVENANVSVKEVQNVKVEVDSLVVNGIVMEVKDKDVDVSVEEVLNVSLEVDSPETKVDNLLVTIKEVENVNVEVDSPVANGILTEVEVGFTKDGLELQLVEPCAYAVEQDELTELRAKCVNQPVESCNGKLDMSVVPELELVGKKETDIEGVAIVAQEFGIEAEAVAIDTSKFVGSTTGNESFKGITEARDDNPEREGNVDKEEVEVQLQTRSSGMVNGIPTVMENMNVPIKVVDNSNVEVDSSVGIGSETEEDNVDVLVKELQNVNVEVEFSVANAILTEVKDEDVDVSIKEVVTVSLEVDSPETKVENLLVSVKEVENVNAEVDSLVANGILPVADVGSTKEGPASQSVEPCAYAVEKDELTKLRATCEIQPIELCNGKHDMVVVPELDMDGGKETDFEGLAIVEQELGIESEVVLIDTSKCVGSTPENESIECVIEAHELFLSTTGDQSANEIIEAHNEAMAPTSDVAVTYKRELMNCFPLNKEVAGDIKWGKSNIMFGTLNVEVIGDQQNGPIRVSSRNLLLEENEGTQKTNDTATMNSPESFRVGEVGEDQKVVTKPFNYLVTFPRADVESLKEQINRTKLLVDEYTKQRDDFQVQIQERRKANNLNHGINYEFAKKELSALRNSVRSKRMEIDSLQSIINKVKDAAFIEDIDQQVSDMERKIQHESIPLKEEKQIIQKIKQLKQRREALCSNMDNREEIKESLEQKETLDGRMKVLRKELDILRANIMKAEAVAREAEMKYDAENEKVKELQARSRAANDSRQESYAQMRSLKKDLYDKNKLFYKYKDCRSAATKHAHSKDTEALHLTCKTQVENFMELWNADAEFRREYVTRNMKSTVRRFGTLDGRSLGPDEKRPIIPGEQEVQKVASTHSKVDCVLGSQILEIKQDRNTSSKDKLEKKISQAKSQIAKLKAAAEPVVDSVSCRDTLEVVAEKTLDSKEEIELAKKADEMRRKEAEDKLKEQRRLEEIELAKEAEEMRRKEAEDKLKAQRRLEELAKANEAREKKKRQEEKEKRRAELRAQKEAEQKDKEREKRLRKKEKKKALLTGSTISTDHSDAGQNFGSAIETSEEMEVKEMEVNQVSTAKQPKIPPGFTKQIRKRYVPPPPCIRNKRSWKNNPWVIRGICVVVIMLLVYIGITWYKSEKPLW